MDSAGVCFLSKNVAAVEEDGKGSGTREAFNGGSTHCSASWSHFHFCPQVRHLLYLPCLLPDLWIVACSHADMARFSRWFCSSIPSGSWWDSHALGRMRSWTACIITRIRRTSAHGRAPARSDAMLGAMLEAVAFSRCRASEFELGLLLSWLWMRINSTSASHSMVKLLSACKTSWNEWTCSGKLAIFTAKCPYTVWIGTSIELADKPFITTTPLPRSMTAWSFSRSRLLPNNGMSFVELMTLVPIKVLSNAVGRYACMWLYCAGPCPNSKSSLLAVFLAHSWWLVDTLSSHIWNHLVTATCSLASCVQSHILCEGLERCCKNLMKTYHWWLNHVWCKIRAIDIFRVDNLVNLNGVFKVHQALATRMNHGQDLFALTAFRIRFLRRGCRSFSFAAGGPCSRSRLWVTLPIAFLATYCTVWLSFALGNALGVAAELAAKCEALKSSCSVKQRIASNKSSAWSASSAASSSPSAASSCSCCSSAWSAPPSSGSSPGSCSACSSWLPSSSWTSVT